MNFSFQATRSLVIKINLLVVTFSYCNLSLVNFKYTCTQQFLGCSSDWSLVIHIGHLPYCWLLVEPPDCCLVHFGKREVLAQIDTMEEEYNEVLSWEDPGPANPTGEPSTVPETPWGEGIQLAGVIQLLKGRQTPSLMADSYGFQSQEELLCVQKYLKDHGGWQLEQVSGFLQAMGCLPFTYVETLQLLAWLLV